MSFKIKFIMVISRGSNHCVKRVVYDGNKQELQRERFSNDYYINRMRKNGRRHARGLA